MNTDIRSCPSRSEAVAMASHATLESGIPVSVVLGQQCPQNEPSSRDIPLVKEVAHDFKNILYVIKGFAELALVRTPDDTKLHRYLKMILDASDRGTGLVGQMLALSPPSKAEMHPIDIMPVVEETVEFVRGSVPDTVSVQLTVAQDMRPVVADPTQLHQVLMNLCANAVHSMGDGGGVLHVALGRIELDEHAASLHSDLRPGPYVRVTVSDTGSGMEPAVAERIFEPYFTTKKEGKGSGLGLSVVQRIVKGCGGAIQVETAIGKGTTCHAFFPTVECASPACSLKRPAEFGTAEDRCRNGLLGHCVKNVRTDMAQIHADIGHLETDTGQCREQYVHRISQLSSHVADLDAHLHHVLSSVVHVGGPPLTAAGSRQIVVEG